MNKTFLATAAAGLLSLSTGAHADAFSGAYNNVSDLVITGTTGIAIGGSVNSSSATACLPNGNCISTGGAGVIDAPVAQIGAPSYVNNSYATLQGAPYSYAFADASIDSLQTQGAPSTQARNVAEGQLLTPTTASANAGNSSATLLQNTIQVGGNGGTVNFRFNAAPYIQTFLSANEVAGAQAEGNISLNLNLIDNAGNIVFNWAPDGIAGGITGGTEASDAFTLNTSLTALSGNNGPLIYDPIGCAPGSGGCFNATTNTLAAGIYTLNLSMRETINLQSTAAVVPEPEGYAMLLAGLAMLGFIARRKQS
jgi:hypothetical protein